MSELERGIVSAGVVAEPDLGRAYLRLLERRIARVLTFGTLAGIGLLAAGVATLVLAGRDPLASASVVFDAGRLVPDLLAGRAEGFIWLGLVILIATPSARVVAALVGFAAVRDRAMMLVAGAILAVIALGVFLGRSGG